MEQSYIDAGYTEYLREIPEWRVADVLGKLQRLSDRSEKLGLPAYHIETGEPEISERIIRNVRVKILATPVRIIAGPPLIPGWRFIAKIDHDQPINEVKGYGAQALVDEDPKIFDWLTTCAPDCEHCGFKRNRNTTFLFQSTDDPDQRIQVGSSCVEDFSGGRHPADVLRLANQFAEVFDEISNEEELGTGGGAYHYVDMTDILTVASAIVRIDGGWVSRDRGGLSGCTVDWITQVMSDSKTKASLVQDGDRVLATIIMDWLNSEDFEVGTDLYRSNLKAMASQGAVKPKAIGLAGSAVATYAREMKHLNERERASEWASVPIGQPGEKVEREVYVEKKIPMENAFGMSVLHILRDTQTNAKMTWFNSGAGKLYEGQTYNITGRVKAHRQRNGLEETQLTRVNCPDLALHSKFHDEMDENALIKQIAKLDNIDARNASGETLLQTASHFYRFKGIGKKIILDLLERGADPGIASDRDGNNAFDYWIDADDAELIEFGITQHPHLTKRWTDQMLADYGMQKKPWALRLSVTRDTIANEQRVNNQANQSVADLLGRDIRPETGMTETLSLVSEDGGDAAEDEALRLA